jgi:hypothetical protein
MSKVAGISLLVLGASAVVYPFFFKKEKKLTNEEILIGKGAESTCDLVKIKLNLVNSEIAVISPEYQKLYSKKSLTDSEKQTMRELGDKLRVLNPQRFELQQILDNKCRQIADFSSSECSVLDGDLKQISDEIAKYSAELLKPTGSTKYSKDTMKILRDKYNILLLKKQNEFAEKNCRNNLEKQNLNESGYLLSTQAEKQEQNVLPSNYKEQYLYIGLGSVVLLTGLYIISKK